MTKKEKAGGISKILDRLYPKTPIPLKHKDAFTLLVAVLLSGNSTDKAVNKVTPALFKVGGNAEKMAKLSVSKIKEIIKPCGLSNNKSKYIKELSKVLIGKFNGKVPDNYKDLESLPGVGHKTASVVMSQAFNYPAFPVDTHIHRLAYRWGISDGKNVVKTEKDLKKVFPEGKWNKLHLQMIFYGREHCPARFHDKNKCQICKLYGRKNMNK